MEIRAEHCVLPTPSPVMEATLNVFWSWYFYITGALVVFALSLFFSVCLVLHIHPAKRDGKKDGRKEITEQRDEMRNKKGRGMRDWTDSVPPT